MLTVFNLKIESWNWTTEIHEIIAEFNTLELEENERRLSKQNL